MWETLAYVQELVLWWLLETFTPLFLEELPENFHQLMSTEIMVIPTYLPIVRGAPNHKDQAGSHKNN
jgi:hypothetical protein